MGGTSDKTPNTQSKERKQLSRVEDAAEGADDATRVLAPEFTEAANEPPGLDLHTLPEEETREAMHAWVKEHAHGIIKLLGAKGRTLEDLIKEVKLYKLGADALKPECVGLLAPPEIGQAAHNAWVKEHLDHIEGREKILPLTGDGRTNEAVAADIALVTKGARRQLELHEKLPALPEEETREAMHAWVKEHAHGIIKLLGAKGRTLEDLIKEVKLYKLGADALKPECVGLLAPPEIGQAAHNAWVKEHLDHIEGREKILPLTGDGRTNEAVAADIALVIAGAKYRLANKM